MADGALNILRLLNLVPKKQLSTILAVNGLPWWFNGKEPPASPGDESSVPGSGRSPGEGHGNPLQYFGLENHMDRGD